MTEGSRFFTTKAFVIVIACSLMGTVGVMTSLASKRTSTRDVPLQVELYLAPREKVVKADGEFTVDLRLNALDKPVNALSAVLNYDTTKVEVLGVDSSQSAFTIDAQAKFGNGTIRIERGQIGNLTGDQFVAKVRMRRTVQSGRSYLSVSKDSKVIESSTNANVLTRYTGTTMVFKR